MGDRKLIEFDGKADARISVAAAARKLSAVLFINVADAERRDHFSDYLFLNPNADNKLHEYMVDMVAYSNQVSVEDFEWDNY